MSPEVQYVFVWDLTKVVEMLVGKAFFFSKDSRISLEVTRLMSIMTRRRIYHEVNGSSTRILGSEDRQSREEIEFLGIVTAGSQAEPGRQARGQTTGIAYRGLKRTSGTCCKKNV